MSDLLILNVNPDDIDVLHLNPRNECNTERDKMADRQTVDLATAYALIARGAARWCEHCHPEEEAHL